MMGYILPITQHEYVNYHARMIESKKSPHHVGEVYKVNFNKIEGDRHEPYTKHQNIEEVEEEEREVRERGTKNFNRGSRGQRYYVDQETNALLTGKGQRMNLQV